MEKLLLVGAGGLGRVVLEHASAQYDCAFLDDGDAVIVDGVPVIGTTSDMSLFFPEYKLLLVTIGNNALRERLYKQAAKIGFTFPNIVVPSAYISPRATLGFGVIILNNAMVQNNAHIGDGCILNPSAEAHHDSTIGNYCLIYTNSVVRSLTHVGDRVWIGSTATVATSANVPDDTIIEDGEVYKAGRGSNLKRTITIFTIAFIATLVCIYICSGIRKAITHQRMLQYNITSARADGTSNRVVMNGKEGVLGYSYVKLQYLEDGWIRLVGENNEDSNGWKMISKFILEPGTYTLTGMKGQNQNIVALQLRIEDNTGYYRYLYQYDEDVRFTVERETTAILHARVYPNVEKVDVLVRPAVYKDE